MVLSFYLSKQWKKDLKITQAQNKDEYDPEQVKGSCFNFPSINESTETDDPTSIVIMLVNAIALGTAMNFF